MINVAINGFGRIGRMILRAGWNERKINFVAINDLTDTKTLAHLLKHDSLQGSFKEEVGFTEDSLIISRKKIRVLAEKDPTKLPWKDLKVDLVIESTGRFTKPQDAAQHILAGARRVLLSAPFKADGNILPPSTLTVLMGVNEHLYNPREHFIISNCSCTTNCIAPVLKVISDNLGIKYCYFSTIHAYTADQLLVDGPHKDLRRARAAAINIIPTSSGADIAVEAVLPQLKGKVKGSAFRVPIACGSVTDFVIEVEKETSIEQVNQILRASSINKMQGLLEYSENDLVSSDIIGNSYSTIVDSKLTRVLNNKIVKIVSWYDNEWGYSCRMVDIIKMIEEK
ncbi:type I glyceraldehyde-3-phosphate dehydrogenase [Candidatus Woesearchaeota archaeon]|nr:type I glyceraldehyde-3-phosphate dehydrogenase [Candidatus Woesearchaeota archaeon]